LPRISYRVVAARLECLLSNKGFPHGEKVRVIDSEHVNGDAAGRCLAEQHRPLPLEVFVPRVYPRMKESNDLSRVWICSSDVRAFVPIAVKAGEREILKNRLTAVLARNNVIDVKR
jgi:hypothetical protein